MTKRFDTSGVTYSVDFAPSCGKLLTDLCRVVDAVFEKTDHYPALVNRKGPLTEALVGFAVLNDSVYYRMDEAEKLLNELLIQLSATYVALNSLPQGKFRAARVMRSHASKLKRLTDAVNELVNRGFGTGSGNHARRSRNITLRFSVIHPDLRSVLTDWQDEVWKAAEQDAAAELTESRKQIMNRLHNISPDLAAAYRATADLMDEVKALTSLTLEDEYFIEQVEEDYIPRILREVESMQKSKSGSKAAETIMQEALKQFRAIEARVQQIIQKGVARQISAMQAQTNFLTQKVVEDESLNLTPNEAYTQIEATAEEAARLRDFLSRKMLSLSSKPSASRTDKRRQVSV